MIDPRRSLFNFKKVLRYHCIFETNIKIRVVKKDTKEVVIGGVNDNMNHDSFDTRFVIFEN